MPTITITQSDAINGMIKIECNNHYCHAAVLSNLTLKTANKVFNNQFKHLVRIEILPRKSHIACRQCGEYFPIDHFNKYTICFYCQTYLDDLERDAIGEY